MHISQIESFGAVVILGLIETLLCRIMKCFFFSFNNVNVYPIKIHWVLTKYGRWVMEPDTSYCNDRRMSGKHVYNRTERWKVHDKMPPSINIPETKHFSFLK